MKVIYFTNAGSRKKNEDSLLVQEELFTSVSFEKYQVKEIKNKNDLIFAVADGIGGRPAGEIASSITLQTIKRYNHYIFEEKYQQLLEKIFINLINYQKKEPDLEGMGTTISLLAIRNNTGYIFHVGDSRIYTWKDSSFELLTRDHSHVQELVEKGFLKHEDINQHPMRNYLKSAITTNIDIHKLQFQSNKINTENKNFFLCSDGIWELIPDKKLKQILTKEQELEKKAEKIIHKSFELNPSDNFSFIMISNES